MLVILRSDAYETLSLYLDDFILELDLHAFVALHLAHVRMIQRQH